MAEPVSGSDGPADTGGLATGTENADPQTIARNTTHVVKTPSHAGTSPGFIFGGSPEGDRLKTHAAVVGHLRNVLNYDFPLAYDECEGWAMNLRRVASAPVFPPAPCVPLPAAPLILPSYPGGRESPNRRKSPSRTTRDPFNGSDTGNTSPLGSPKQFRSSRSRGALGNSQSMGVLLGVSSGGPPRATTGPRLFES
eukprot:TRINITY_DN44215_c0_g1_i1.p1 TRINITY_DN44215_c0_g1~~TRINITY_DN44215_c0_g1_i1.p1  ORF type:complete len:196 (+),score=14.39 TRINITY_DN44215_c0_g1_i1:137-724(+)